MAKERRSKMTLLKEDLRKKYDVICQEIKRLEGQKEGIVEALHLCNIQNPKEVIFQKPVNIVIDAEGKINHL